MKKTNLLIIALISAQLACSSAGNQTPVGNSAANNAAPVGNSAAAGNAAPANTKVETNTAISNKETAKSAAKPADLKTADARSKVVRFEKGATSATYEEDLAKGAVYKFTVGAKKDQLMAVRTGTDSGEVTFSVSHNGKTIPSSVETSKWSDKLSADGDYVVTATRKSGTGKFKIEFNVENE